MFNNYVFSLIIYLISICEFRWASDFTLFDKFGDIDICFKELHWIKACSSISISDDKIEILSTEEQKPNEEYLISFTDWGTIISFNDEHILNELAPIFNKEGGKDNFDKAEHWEKASSSIEINEGGNVISINDEQSLKALLSILVTEGGRVILVNEEHSLKVPTPIDEINEFIVTWLKLMHLSKE